MAGSGFITKTPQLRKSRDYAFLRAQGLKYIEQLGHERWTDYNAHDPGITILELLCYALTDLGYRNGYDIKDILAEPVQTLSGPKQPVPQLHTAREIFPNGTVTFNDLRKVLLDIEGVRNAWIEPYTALKYGIDPRTKEFVYDKSSDQYLRGLYNVLIEYEKPRSEVLQEQYLQKRQLQQKVRERILANRNVCEDLVQICDSATEEIAVCANIEVRPTADVENVLAEIFYRMQEHVSPRVRFYTLSEMLAKGKRVDAIFEGPALRRGFIDDDELSRITRRCEIRTSDIINLLMGSDLPEVIAIRKISLLSFMDGKPRTEQNWILPLATDKFRAPIFSPERSKIVFYKDGLPYYADRKSVYELLDKKEAEAQRSTATTPDLPIPLGEARAISSYTPAQNDMPATYCVGQIRVPDSEPPVRKAQSKQLKAYLLLFEQLLANHLAQLSHINDLFSWEQKKIRGYFSNVIDDISGLDQVYLQKFSVPGSDADKPNARLLKNGLDQLAEPHALPAMERRNRMLDHLLARFGEDFSQYESLMRSLYRDQPQQVIKKLIRHKCWFLQDYPETSKHRNGAVDYRLAEEKAGLSGFQKRVYRLIGIRDASHWRPLAGHFEIQPLEDQNASPPKQYWFVLNQGEACFKSINCESRTSIEILLDLALSIGGNRDNYQRSSDGNAYELFRCCPDCDKKTIIGRVPSSRESALDATVQYFKDWGESEGFHFIEHILLRKRNRTDPVLPVQLAGNGPCGCPKVTDPYSFRASVILPAWPRRFRDVRFRRFVEETLRREAPAHVFLKICWISHQQMQEFELAYRSWMRELAALRDPQPLLRPGKLNVSLLRKSEPMLAVRSPGKAYSDALRALENMLHTLVTVYPLARLYDRNRVSGDEPQITLNNTNLGTY